MIRTLAVRSTTTAKTDRQIYLRKICKLGKTLEGTDVITTIHPPPRLPVNDQKGTNSLDPKREADGKGAGKLTGAPLELMRPSGSRETARLPESIKHKKRSHLGEGVRRRACGGAQRARSGRPPALRASLAPRVGPHREL